MLIEDFKKGIALPSSAFQNLISELGLEGKEVIDDILAENLLQRYEKNMDFINKSSLKRIKIVQLFGKYDYDLEFTSSINIFVAENGHGKTTIIKILVAALRNDYNLLHQLPFKKIEIYLSNGEKIEIENNKSDRKVNESLYEDEDGNSNAIIDMKALHRVDIPRGIRMAIRFLPKDGFFSFDEFKFELRKLYQVGQIPRVQYNRCIEFVLDEELLISNDNILNINEIIKYLPTFRRVEAELHEVYRKDLNIENQIKGSTLKFGLKDVEAHLDYLTSKLTKEAFETHANLNGEILSDLLNNRPLKISTMQKKEITLEKVKIIIGRIGKDKVKAADQLRNFIENDNAINDNENKDFLEYYLYKLIRIYENQREIDNKIKSYRDICNKYLINKELIYDEAAAKVTIVDKEDFSLITFPELSSGEKQILSIFSELYLEDSEKMIYIIDEPELSLSIAWQKNILEDIYNSGKVALLIATTHSPFIFKNKLNDFAKDLNRFKFKSVTRTEGMIK